MARAGPPHRRHHHAAPPHRTVLNQGTGIPVLLWIASLAPYSRGHPQGL